MAIIKASMAFKKESISDNVNFGNNVTAALTIDAAKPSPLFPNLPVPIETLQQTTSNLSAANLALVNGGRIARETANAMKEEWNIVFAATANYITSVSENNAQVIAFSGFIPTKGTREKWPLPGVPNAFKATINGTKGAVLAGAKKRASGAVANVVTALPKGATIRYLKNTAIITIGNQNIYLGAFTGNGTEMYNLTSGDLYSISMFSVNAAGFGPATAPQEVIPQ